MKQFVAHIILLLCLVFGGTSVFAQDYKTSKTVRGSALKNYKKGTTAFRNKDLKKALKFYEKALDTEPTFVDAYIRKAQCLHDLGDIENAVLFFKKSIKLAPEYKNSVYYELALTQWRRDSFASSAKYFDQYLKREKRNTRVVEKAKKHLRNALFSVDAVKNPVDFQPIRMSDSINTDDDEYLPSISVDGKLFIYGKRKNGKEDFYVARKNELGTWSKGKALKSLNSPHNEASQTMSADGQLFVFTACNRPEGLGRCDLYYSVKKGKDWSIPQNMGAPINTSGWEAQPSLSADGQTLYFTAKRKGGFGGSDLWKSTRKKNGRWGVPQNLGDSINTAENDESPFIHNDGTTLYFKSSGHPGLGKDDLFVAKMNQDGSWGKPKNLGYPINKKGNEGALFIALDGKTAYYSSDSKALNDSNFDIYTFELPEDKRANPVTYVQAKVFDKQSKWPLEANVTFVNLSTGETIYDAQCNPDGEFLVCLPLGADYALNVSNAGYLFQSENFSLNEVASLSNPYVLDIGLMKAELVKADEESAKPIVLKNIFFETGEALLLPESIFELKKLKKLLTENPEIRIRINGHTDNIGSEADNLILSEARAKAVQDYLVKEGIDAERLSFKGFGENQPIDSNDTPKGRANNRRTEFQLQ